MHPERGSVEVELKSTFGRGDIPTDRDFDMLLSPGSRSRSKLHWTPVRVAVTVGRLLASSTNSRVLDVGSGCGKFACIGAITTPGHFVGIEQRPQLHRNALELCERLKLDRASFVEGDALAADWNAFTAIYLFNPFWENLLPLERFDGTAMLKVHQFSLFTKIVIEKLSRLPAGTLVATYHGFGGEFPPTFRKIHSMNIGRGPIEIWVKES
jgi:predicted RNA methylase